MAVVGLVDPALEPYLAAPHVVAVILGEFHFGSGLQRLHTGTGTLLTNDGNEWRGVSDPGVNRVVNFGRFELPEPDTAPLIEIILSGVDIPFLQGVRASITEVEGRKAELFVQVYDPDTFQPVGDAPIKVFAEGRMSAPTIKFEKAGIRAVRLPIEGEWSSKNFAPGSRWTHADQQRLWPGDKIFEFVGTDVEERWPKLTS